MQIQIKNLNFQYSNNPDSVFENTSFEFDTNWKLGFTGRNGRGKTTFLKILTGELQYSGTINPVPACQYLSFDLLSAEPMEDLPTWEIEKHLSLLQADPSIVQRPNDISPGELTKLIIAQMFVQQQYDNSLLLLDEPTNHLDTTGKQALGKYLSNQKSFILVSHDTELLDIATDHTLSINKSNIEIYHTNYSGFLEQFNKHNEYELKKSETLMKEIEELTSSKERFLEFSQAAENRLSRISGQTDNRVDKGFLSKKSSKLAKKYKSKVKAIEKSVAEKSQLLHNTEQGFELQVNPLPWKPEWKDIALVKTERTTTTNETSPEIATTLSAEAATQATPSPIGTTPSERRGIPEGSARTNKAGIEFKKIPFRCLMDERPNVPHRTIKEFDQLQLSGPNGCGKTTFLRTIVENAKTLFPADFIISYLEQVDSSNTNQSSGQTRLNALSKALSKPAHLYILDEPLNYLDHYFKQDFYQLLQSQPFSLLLVDHNNL